VVAQFQHLGCPARQTPFGLVVVEPAHGADPGPVLRRLRQGARESKWDFDLGVTPDADQPSSPDRSSA
jgi:hypothetical protein